MTFRHKARKKSPPNPKLNRIKNLVMTSLGLIYLFLKTVLTKIIQYIIQHIFQPAIKYLWKRRLLVSVLLSLAFLSVITLAAILPGTHTFEGNVIFEEVSFTYDNQQPKFFLGNMREIKSLEHEGKQTLTFTGGFESESLPEINKLNSLKIELTERESKFIISPANSDLGSEINLDQLRIQPQTRIAKLNYDFYRQQLSFSLLPNPKNLENNRNLLEQIYLGEQPIKVIVEGYKLPDLNLESKTDEIPQLEFIVNPDNKEFNLDIQEKTDIFITLSKPLKDKSEQWFRGKIKTKDVKFTRIDKNGGNPTDDLEISTIIAGKIRMAEQDREIQTNQFLMGENSNKPLNIQLIRHLQIIPDKKGIEARFSGTTKQIQIGLDEDFPVSSIQGSWLDGVLPRDAIVALFSFTAATVVNLVAWLFSNASQANSSNSNQP